MARRHRSALAILLLSSAACLGPAQEKSDSPNKPKPQPPVAMARDANPGWEVATVKASNPNDTRGQHINMPGRHIALLDTTVEQFLLLGYGVQQSQLAALPDWAKTTRWDIDGVPDAEGQPSWKQLQTLIQKILAERFSLQLHHEQREMPVFALTVSKSGPKLTPNTSDPNGWMDQQNGGDSSRHIEHLKNASIADLAEILEFHVDRPIVDQTGLKGRYDLNLQWTVDDPQNENQPPTPDAPPGLFTAIQDQIGLKLDRVKAPADTLVIDKLQRPEAN